MKIFTVLFFVSVITWANMFEDPNITTSYSDKLLIKNARNDSLLPTFDGEESLKELFRQNPQFWKLQSLEKEINSRKVKIITQLRVELVFVDGTQEEAFCNIASQGAEDDPYVWNLKIGLDFISGGSNVVGEHVQLCLNRAKEELGMVLIGDDGIKELILPKKEEDDMLIYRVNAELTSKQKRRVYSLSEEVHLKGKCPTDIDAYLDLLDLFEKVGQTSTTPMQVNDELNPMRNGARVAESCAFSREWNQLYNETLKIRCNINKHTCESSRSGSGDREWVYDHDSRWFEYQGNRFLGIGFGAQSVRFGGEVLHMRLIPLSSNIYLESYLNHQGEPKSLGLVVLEPFESSVQ